MLVAGNSACCCCICVCVGGMEPSGKKLPADEARCCGGCGGVGATPVIEDVGGVLIVVTTDQGSASCCKTGTDEIGGGNDAGTVGCCSEGCDNNGFLNVDSKGGADESCGGNGA